MRWVIGAHKTTGSKFGRHAETEAQAIDRAQNATKQWLKQHPDDEKFVTEALLSESTVGRVDSGAQLSRQRSDLPEASGKDGSRTQKVELQPFSTSYFNCIVCNPIAQVWQCIAREGERNTPGRRRADGSRAHSTPLFHQPGECAVLMGNEPLRTPDGSVVVFPNWSQAAEKAQELYDEADEEDRLLWREGDLKVYSTISVDVIFDPEQNGASKPFSLWLPEYRRPVYEDRTRPIPGTELPTSKIDATVNPQAKLEEKERRAKHRAFNREPSFEERPLRFRGIAGAIAEAERRERMLKGQTVV